MQTEAEKAAAAAAAALQVEIDSTSSEDEEDILSSSSSSDDESGGNSGDKFGRDVNRDSKDERKREGTPPKRKRHKKVKVTPTARTQPHSTKKNHI